MARRRRRTVVSRGTGANRKFIWARQFFTDDASLTAPLFIDALDEVQTAIGADLVGTTLVRVRGDVLTVNTSATAGNSLIMAMRVFTTSTLGGLVGANGPQSDPLADWLMFEPFVHTGTGNDNYSAERRMIDTKSSRKLEEVGQSVLLAFQGGSVDPVQVAGILSLGLKLP